VNDSLILRGMTRFVAAILCAFLARGCFAQIGIAQFTGTWVVKNRHRNFLVLALRLDHDRVAGTLVRPEHFSYDADGEFTILRRDLSETTVADSVIHAGQLEFSTGSGSDQDHWEMKFIDRDHAELQPREPPGRLPPWRLRRANASARVASDWPELNPVSPKTAALQAELKKMADEDQVVRTAVPASLSRMQEVDRTHLPALLRIHRKYGWLKSSVAGKEAAGRFWLLVQHQNLELQKSWMPEMERLAAKGAVSRQNFALLYDRVMSGEGKPQRWGTQTHCVDGKAVMNPVEDPQNLEARRNALYLTPVNEELEMLTAQCKNLAP
jgi:hypothetical protein